MRRLRDAQRFGLYQPDAEAEREPAQGEEPPRQTTPTEQCGWLATGIPDYQLRRKVAIGMAGIEPARTDFLGPRSTNELHPVSAGGIFRCGFVLFTIIQS